MLVHVDATDLDATKVDFDVQDKCQFGALPPLLDLGRFMRPFAHQVQEPDGTLFEMETGPGTPNWTPIEYVSPFFVQAVVAHEDGRFFGHHGFAEPEIGVALSRNLKAKAFKFGASTITMQLVRNVFLHRDKLLARKVQEALIVWWLEQHWDKRRILELYLNVIEYGPAIYGIRNASMHYFGVLPMDLTPAQAGFLACILPSPKSSHVNYEKGALSTSAKNRIANLLKHMQFRERIDAEALAYGLEELEQFRFYNPNQPPPAPPQIRGTAQKPPFNMADTILDPWESFLPPDGSESGGFGSP
jgi:membrane peptidoglycan carboxypeptidase